MITADQGPVLFIRLFHFFASATMTSWCRSYPSGMYVHTSTTWRSSTEAWIARSGRLCPIEASCKKKNPTPASSTHAKARISRRETEVKKPWCTYVMGRDDPETRRYSVSFCRCVGTAFVSHGRRNLKCVFFSRKL